MLALDADGVVLYFFCLSFLFSSSLSLLEMVQSKIQSQRAVKPKTKQPTNWNEKVYFGMYQRFEM